MLENGTPAGGPVASYCHNCGHSLELQAQFCPDCGTRREPAAAYTVTRPVDTGFTPPPSDVSGRSIPGFGVPSIFGPKGFGDLLNDAFRIYSAGFLAIVILVAVVEVPLSLLTAWFGGIIESGIVEVLGPLEDAGDVNPDQLAEAFGGVLGLAAPLLLLTWIASVVLNGALIYAVSHRILGNQFNVGNAYTFALGRILSMLGASLLVIVVVILTAVTIIGIPLAIFLAIRWAFALQTAALERRGPLGALARSNQLVSGEAGRGNWWRVLAIMLATAILVAIASGLAGAILGYIPYIGPAIVAVVFAPILPIVQILLYHDLRVRRDTASGYTPEILAAELDSPRPSDVL